MRRTMLSAIAILGSLSLAWAEPAKTTALKIDGMTCGGCVAAVKVQLGRTAGVLNYDVSLEKGEATVGYDPARTTPQKIADSVSDTGFHASVEGSTPQTGTAGAASATATPGDAPGDAASSDTVTLFQVPLMCPAVKGLGCGGKARPFMADLEKRPEIAQAWLNHPGTLLAVVWKEPEPRSSGVRLVQSLFGAKDLSVTPLEGAAREKALQDFAARKGWYEGQDVNRLSEQEAQALAHRMARRVASRAKLSADSASALEADLRTVCTRALLEGRGRTDAGDLMASAAKYLNSAQRAILKDSLEQGFGPEPGDEQD